MPLTVKDFDRVVGKLKMVELNSKHRKVWFVHNGKKILWTERSHGRGEIGNVEHAIRRQLRVTGQQMRNLADCPMTLEAYIEHLKLIRVIEDDEQART